MAKTKISEYDAIAANNTDVNSINIAEGCAPSGINNAIRQVMADLKDFQQGTKGDAFLGQVSSPSLTLSSLTANRVLYTNGSKVVATSDNMQFDGTTTTLNALTVDAAFAANGGVTLGNATGDALTINSSAVSIPNGLNFGSNNLVLSGGNVGIGTSSPTSKLQVNGTGTFGDLTQKIKIGLNGDSISMDGDFYIQTSTANPLILRTNGTERMRLDSSGNVGIGTSSPNYRLDVTTTSTVASSFNSNQSEVYVLLKDSGTTLGNVRLGSISNAMTMFAGGAERIRIDSSGNLLVGTTTTSFSNTDAIALSAAQGYILQNHINGSASGKVFTYFSYNANAIGTISQTGTTGVLYNVTSDYRLKTVIAPVSDSGTRLDALKPIEYDWKAGGRTRGFLAHQFAEVYPNSVSGEKDAVDKDGKPVYQGMQASTPEVMADLIAEIQSLRKRVAQLESK